MIPPKITFSIVKKSLIDGAKLILKEPLIFFSHNPKSFIKSDLSKSSMNTPRKEEKDENIL